MLDGLDLEVADGSLTAVLGPSGCGKTTLLRLIAGFERADGGTIRVGERVVCDARTHVAPEQRGVGFVAQEGALFPHLDVAANVAFGLPRARSAARRACGSCSSSSGSPTSAKRRPHELSGGQQQRVALARALAPAPQLVLLDEPFDALDASLRAQVRAEVREVLRDSGATALLVTHDQEEALSLADVVAVMRDGAIVQAADPQTLYRDPVDAELAGFLGEAVLLPGELHDGHADTALGRLPIARLQRRSPRRSASVMLRPEQILCREPLAGAAARTRARDAVLRSRRHRAHLAAGPGVPGDHRARRRAQAAGGRRRGLARRRGHGARLSAHSGRRRLIGTTSVPHEESP